jgi:hypothetical protein
MRHPKLATGSIGLGMNVAAVRQLTPRRYVDSFGPHEAVTDLPRTGGASFPAVRAGLRFHRNARSETARAVTLEQ